MLSNELKQNPFNVPDNYFESLQERVEKKANMLSGELKQNPFSVPEGYFESLQVRVAERIAGTAPAVKASPVFEKHRSWQAQLTFVASFIFLVGMGYGMFSLLSKTDPTVPAGGDDIYALLRAVSPNINSATVLDAMLDDASAANTKVVLKSEDVVDYLADANLSIYDIVAALE